jgi:hypothetical protein
MPNVWFVSGTARLKRRSAARRGRTVGGPWKIVVWVALEVLWLVALLAILGVFNRAHG